MVQNATILNDVTVDHSNITVASVNCKQSISTHCDKITHDGCGTQAICAVNHENQPTEWRQASELPSDPLLNPESAPAQDDLWMPFD